MIGRRLRALALLAFIPALLIPTLADPAPVVAAPPSLAIVTATTYDVRPAEGRVIVTARLTATNRLRDTATRRYFFRTAYLAVLPGTSRFAVSGGRGSPKVSVSRRAADHTLLRIDLGANLAAGASTTLTLRFDLRDPGGAPDRPVRISPSLVTFPAWAFGSQDTPGSSVTVALPAEYDVEIGRGPLRGPTTLDDGRQAWTSGRLGQPLEFIADVIADRPGEHLETARTVRLANGEATLLLRPWPDDPDWRDRVGDLVARALPVLEREIGLPWPVAGQLAVEESHGRAAGGAAVFDPASGLLQVSYAAPDGAILRELAHAWFNGRLVADRWIAEAFASYYAELAGAALGLEPESPELTEDLLPAAIPLNAWGRAGTGSAPVEAYGQAAALALARLIATRAGSEALSATWSAAANDVGAYQPAVGGDEPLGNVVDWRSLLDLLEDRTGKPFEDLWLAWVARTGDQSALQARAKAREHLATTVAAAGAWGLPRVVRDALRAWQFERAEELLDAADRALAARDELEAAARSEGLALPDRARAAFEGGDGFALAEAEARAQLAAIAAIRDAEAARPRREGPWDEAMVALGLLGTDPDEHLADASAALAGGDLQGAFDEAAAAEHLFTNATQVGRGRIVSAGLLGLSILLLAGLVRGRRRGMVHPTA